MPKCNRCGGEILFRYVGGICTPIHLSGGCFEGSSTIRTSKTSENTKSIYTYDSFVNPHATCPVCEQEVFYYQSPTGGRVFFDALGPPWPKHPCTDNPIIAAKVIIRQGQGEFTGKRKSITYAWQSAGWEPFYAIEIKEVHNDKYVSIRGVYKGKEITLYVRNNGIFPKKSPIHLRERDTESYELSTILLTRSSLTELEQKHIAFISLHLAHIRTKPTYTNRSPSRLPKKDKTRKAKKNMDVKSKQKEKFFTQENRKKKQQWRLRL